MKARFLFTIILLLPLSLAISQEAVISGELLGHDGQPMPAARLFLFDRGGPIAQAKADQTGKFEIKVARAGGFILILCGVHHKTIFVPVVIDNGEQVQWFSIIIHHSKIRTVYDRLALSHPTK